MHIEKGHSMDEQLQSKFANHQSELNPQAWDSILSEVEAHDRKRGCWAWFSGVALVLIALASWAIFTDAGDVLVGVPLISEFNK